MKVTKGYSAAQIALHWLIAVGVVVNYVFSEGMGKALKEQLEGKEISVGVASWHVYIGIAIFVLALLRLALRLTRGGPAADPGPQGKAAAVMHGLLYLLFIGVPLGGALAWYKGLEILAEPHALFANVLIILAGLHAVLALYHHYVVKDDVMRRMMRPE